VEVEIRISPFVASFTPEEADALGVAISAWLLVPPQFASLQVGDDAFFATVILPVAPAAWRQWGYNRTYNSTEVVAAFGASPGASAASAQALVDAALPGRGAVVTRTPSIAVTEVCYDPTVDTIQGVEISPNDGQSTASLVSPFVWALVAIVSVLLIVALGYFLGSFLLLQSAKLGRLGIRPPAAAPPSAPSAY